MVAVPMSELKSEIGGRNGAPGLNATMIAMLHGPDSFLRSPWESLIPTADLDYVLEAGRKAQIEHVVCNCIAFGWKNSELVLD